jgi:hypothetical protein
MKYAFLVTFLAALGFAQANIPGGTILPVQLNSSIRSSNAHAGNKISARIMQDVPLPNGGRIRAGEKVIGLIVSVRPSTNEGPAEVSFVFDSLAAGKQRTPVSTSLRALASMMDVEEAQIPQSGPDRGTPQNWWTTDQIGGQVNYHGNGAITEDGEIVGHSSKDGVLAHPGAAPGSPCRGDLGADHQLQAFWVFSSIACGLYGYPELTLRHAGRTNPEGQIILQSKKGDVHLRAGSGMLLRVTARQQ